MKSLIALPLVIAACLPALAQNRPSTTGTPTTPTQRYQIVFSPHVRADTFLLDTYTGQVWQMTTITDVKGDPTVWLIMDRIDSSIQARAWYLRQEPKAKESKSPQPEPQPMGPNSPLFVPNLKPN